MASGVVAAAAVGAAVAGLYAVLGALFFGQPVGGFLRWSLWPVAPIVVIAAVTGWLSMQLSRTPRGGWDALLTFPPAAVLFVTAGTVLVQLSMTADRWPSRLLLIDGAGRVGGLLLGVGVAWIVADRLGLRLLIAAPLGVFLAAVASWQATGMFGVIVAVAVAVWWLRRLWTVIRSPAQPTLP